MREAPVGVGGDAATAALRDRVIPLRKSDLIDGLLARGQLDEAAQASFKQLARMLGAIFHYQYLGELERLREAYFISIRSSTRSLAARQAIWKRPIAS